MATATASIYLGTRRQGGAPKTVPNAPAGVSTAHVSVTIDTSVVLLRGDFLEACKQAADQFGLK